MRYLRKLGVLLALAAFLGTATAYAGVDEDKDKDKDKDKKKSEDARSLSAAKLSSMPGDCNLGSASSDLDVNNVRARVYNNGGLFWRGSGNVYTVPKTGSANSIFASGIWIGGLANGDELRFAGTAYGPWEFWPGPLDDSGNPPADCSQYDRIFNVTADQVDALRRGALTSVPPDIQDWPADLGAPFVDVNSDGVYNVADGDYPEVIGAQTAWWIMNDAGNTKAESQTAEIGLEVQVTAFAFRTADALNNTTFYKYKLIHKGDDPLVDTYFGIWSDPDLGDASDDYVGSDTLLGMAYVYNGDDFDAGVDGYGSAPPATGYDYFQGPLVPCSETRPCSEDGGHTDPDGTFHPDSVRIQMSKFVYYNNDSSVFGNPDFATDDPYNYLRGIWRDGTRMTFGGNGYGGSTPTDYMFPGDPVQRGFWSEENTDGAGSRNTPADRRFLMSSGPFTMRPGDVQEIVYGIVWSQAPTRLGSVAQLRFDDILAQGAYNFNFQLPPPPDEPQVSVEPLDGAVALSWSNPPTSNNYLNTYDLTSPFLIDPTPPDSNVTYTFEGYKIYQFTSPTDQTGEVIAVLDVANNVTQIIDQTVDPLTGAVITQLVANGADTGVRNDFLIEGLTNYRSYTFGLQAYAYNPNSAPKIYASPINRFTVQPAPTNMRGGGTDLNADTGDIIPVERTQGSGDTGGLSARVVNPVAVTGDTYEVRIYTAMMDDTTEVITYDIVNATTGETELSGEDYIARNGRNVPFGQDVIVIDGLSFSVDGPPPGVSAFLVTSNAAGPLVPPDHGSFSFNANGFPTPDGEPAHCSADPVVVDYSICNDRPSAAQQTGEGRFGINVGGGDGTFESYLSRSIFGRSGNADVVGANDYEWRFTDGTSLAIRAFEDDEIVEVPFEIWNTGVATPDDPSDDYRMIPLICEAACGGGTNEMEFDFGGDHPVSGGDNDPLSDWIYWYNPIDQTPGESGYLAYENAADIDGMYGQLDHEVLARQVIVNWNGGSAPPYVQGLPEEGTVFRIVTNKPLAAGDIFALNTTNYAPVTGSDSVAVASLDQIGIVPNPYKGASAYEVSALNDEVRFTGLPSDGATIRVFSLSGDLIRTMSLSSFNNRWDLTTEEGLPVASGMYLIHVETEAGERVVKFGVVKKRIQLDLF